MDYTIDDYQLVVGVNLTGFFMVTQRVIAGPVPGGLDRRPGYRPGILRARQDHPGSDPDAMAGTRLAGRMESWQNRLFMNAWAASSPSPP
jgi:hypothetical protein